MAPLKATAYMQCTIGDSAYSGVDYGSRLCDTEIYGR